ncbi:MAG: hypothetical protein KDA24_12475 [Deltaproteobacteria bacterium]|nr:hypothetical protein [Deltaproteobacteria bacterium]
MNRLLLALPFAVLLGMAPSLASDAAHVVGLEGLSQDLEGVGAAEAAFIRRAKIRKKTTSGYRVVVVVGDDATNNEVDSVDVVVDHVPGQPLPQGGTLACDDDGSNCSTTLNLPLKVVKANGNKRFVFNDLDFSDDATNFSFGTTTTLKDAANQPVGVPVSSVVEVEDSGDVRLRSVIVRQLDDTNFEMRAVVVGDFTDAVQEVWVCIADYTGPDPEPDDCFTLANPTVDGGKKVFSITDMSFSDPSAAADEVYSTVVDLRDATLGSLGATEVDIVVQGLAVDELAVLQAENELLTAELAALEAVVDAALVTGADVSAFLAAVVEALEADPTAPLESVGAQIQAAYGYHLASQTELSAGAVSPQ